MQEYNLLVFFPYSPSGINLRFCPIIVQELASMFLGHHKINHLDLVEYDGYYIIYL